MAKKRQLEETQKGGKSKFLKELTISNYGVFPYQKKDEDAFEITFNVPDGKTKGSGLTIIIGGNACGKTTLLDALLQTKEQGDVPQLSKNVYARERPSSVRSNPSELSFLRFYSFREQSNTLERFEGTQMLYELQDAKAIELSDIIKNLKKRADENRENKDLHYIDLFNASRIRKDKLLGSEVVKQNLHSIRYAEMHDNDEPSDLFHMGEGILALRYLSGLLKFSMSKTEDTADKIFLIDEPEQHLHPEAITKLVELLCDIGKTCQIVLTTHSLQIVEDILSSLRGRDNQKEPEKHFRILTKENGKIILTDMSKCLLPYASASEINYVALSQDNGRVFQ